MSHSGYEKFNTWFPALVVGFVIGILVAAVWDLVRRRFWLFVSRFWPGVRGQVGLDDPYLSHARVEERLREISNTLSGFASQINFLVSANSSIADPADRADSFPTESSCSSDSSVSSNFATSFSDIEGQGGINRLPGTPIPHTYPNYTSMHNHMCPGTTLQGKVIPEQHSRPVAVTGTAFFPDGTSNDVVRPAKRLFKRYASGPVKRMKSSIILQASLLIDPCVLAEIGELAKKCMSVENRCTFQLGNWAILYYNADKVHLHILKEGDVPVNLEARWQFERTRIGTRITMRGMYLTGAEVKAGTQRTSVLLKSAGPVTPGPGDLDELDVTTKELDVPGNDPLIYASKLVECADGISLIVRSDARLILPPLRQFPPLGRDLKPPSPPSLWLAAFTAFIVMTSPFFVQCIIPLLTIVLIIMSIHLFIKRHSSSCNSIWAIIIVGTLFMVLIDTI